MLGHQYLTASELIYFSLTKILRETKNKKQNKNKKKHTHRARFVIARRNHSEYLEHAQLKHYTLSMYH